jgi:hypothetical protein
MATDDTLIVHPGDIIQGTQQGPSHGHLFLVTETHRWGVGAVHRWSEHGADKETYWRFKAGQFAVVGVAPLMPPEVAAARRDSVEGALAVAREKAEGGDKVMVEGPPVTPELQLLFGAYAAGSAVRGVVALRDGISVGYADGSEYLFVAVPDGSNLVCRPDGKLEVKA